MQKEQLEMLFWKIQCQSLQKCGIKRIDSIIIYSMYAQDLIYNPFQDAERTQNPYLSCQILPSLAKSNTDCQQYAWIDECLNLQAFRSPFQLNEDISNLEPQCPPSPHVQSSNLTKQSEVVVQRTSQHKNRSIFHNFQKHVITLLKRIVNVKRVELLNQASGLKAYQLWKSFKISKDYTKKTLYMVFGVSEEENIKNLRKLGEKQPDLQKMLEKCTIEDIEMAQALLRQKVGQQISQIKKQVIKRNCKMAKFQQFYSYFRNFIQQLSNDGLSKRLRKDQKIRLVESNNSLAQQRF